MGGEGMGKKRREGERKGERERNKNPPSDRSGYGPVSMLSSLTDTG